MTHVILSRREGMILATLLTMVFGIIGYKGIYGRIRENHELLEEKIEKAERQLSRNRRLIHKGKSYEQKYAQWVDQFKKAGSDEQIMSATLSEIEGIANQLKIHVSDMKPQRVKKEDQAQVYSVSLILDGRLPQIMEFLHILQSPPYFFQYEEIRLEKKSFNSSDLKCYIVLNRLLVKS